MEKSAITVLKYFTISLLLLSTSAFAEDVKLDPSFAGFYGKDEYCAVRSDLQEYCGKENKKLLIRVRNNVFMMVDNANNVRFRVDFNNSNEHVVSKDYKRFLEERSMAVKGFLDDLTVSDHQILNDGKEIKFNFNFNFKFESMFGKFNGTIALPIKAAAVEKCQVRTYDAEKIMPCIKVYSEGMRFTKLDTSLPKAAENAVGLTLDFIFRVFSILANPLADSDLYKNI